MAGLMLIFPLISPWWYIVIPETLYILYAFLRDLDTLVADELWLIGLVIYDIVFCVKSPAAAMGAAAVVICLDFLLHRRKPKSKGYSYYSDYDTESEDDSSSCPYCGSGDTDGNHCYTCGKDF